MSNLIDTTYSQRKCLPYFDNIAVKKIKKKGWSYSYVYEFSEIRDIYLALRKKRFSSLNEFVNFCIEIKLPSVGTKWTKRRIEEHLNALKNFELINSDYTIKQEVFTSSNIGDPIDQNDLSLFQYIYFTYFRFKEIFVWLINPEIQERESYIDQLTDKEIIKQSKPLFTFSENTRFTDSFFYNLTNNPLIYYIESRTKPELNIKPNGGLMRFWDVFIKWGNTLGVLEKFNLDNLGIKTNTGKTISCTYVLNENYNNFNLLSYIENNFTGAYIYIPTLVFSIALNLRIKIENIHKIIIEQYKLNKEYLSLERTSEIFVKKLDINSSDKIFFPKYNDSYVSHLILRK